MTGLDINVKGEQLPDAPWTWVAVSIEYTLRGRGLQESAVRRAIELSEEKYCSIGATVGGRTEIRSSYRIVEE